MSSVVRWGIAGTGLIAGVFARAMEGVDGGHVAAVGSRTEAAARRFADELAVPRAHGSYEALAADPEVDAVYVATPHTRHLEIAEACLDAGKHVLCEKPMSLSARQSTRMAEIARARGRFLMEALWSRFLPAYRTIDALVGGGEIGDVLCVEASLGFRAPLDPSHRLFALELGGGALLDLGIYPVHLVHSVLGPPSRVQATGRIGTTGVDEHTVVTMAFPDGALAIAHAAIRTPLAGTARITGSDGVIEVPAPMHGPPHLDVVRPEGARPPTGTPPGSAHLDLIRQGGGSRRIETPHGDAPFRFQIEEVHRCLAAGLTESPVMPLAASLAIATTLDLAKAEIGLAYPGE